MIQSTNIARNTAYAANQHSVSIIGSDIGKAHIPKNFANNRDSTADQNIMP